MKAEWGKTGSLALPLVMVVALLYTGCTNFFGKQSSSGATASLVVSFSAPLAKTVTASSSDLLSAVSTLAIAVVNSSGTTVATGAVTYSSGTTKTFDSLTAATYMVDVNAYDASSNLIATGTQTVAMAGNTSVTVDLSFSQTSTVTSGGFSLNIAWPTSTNLPYVYAKLDSTSASAFFSATGTVSSSNYTATIAKSGLSSGSHLLYIYFAASSTVTTYLGPYIETVNIWDGVTSTSWLDGSGNCLSQRSFAASDFASSNANLEGLSISGATLSPAFAAGTTSYSLSSGFTSTSFTFIATTVSGTQNVAYTWNGAAQSWTSVSGDVFTASSLSLVSGLNTLVLTMTAPDKQTTKTYTVNVNCGAAGGTITTPSPSYAGLGFPSSATIVQGAPFALETSNSTLDAITSGWQWYLGDAQDTTQTTQRFVFSPSTTESMLGTYSLSGSVVGSDGVTYTGRTALTVNRSSLNPSGVISSTYTGFNGPVGIALLKGVLYVTEFNSDVVSAVDLTSSTPSRVLLAGNGTAASVDASGTSASFNIPHGIATDGCYVYVVDTGSGALRKIDIATKAVTTLVTDATRLKGSGMMTFDGSYLYVTHSANNAIYRINPTTAAISTVATISGINPWGIATDGSYFYVSVIGGSASMYRVSLVDGTSSPFTTNYGYGVYACGGYLYASDYSSKVIRKILISNPSTVTTLTPRGASLSDPRCLVTDGASLYLVDFGNNCVYTIN